MLAGVPVHVVQRGNNRSACFAADEDRSFYLFHLDRMLPRFGCALHAYCLMTNHVHLLLSPDTEGACGLLMKNVAQLYSQYFNKRYTRSGSLWEARYRSSIVQDESYLLACYRYVELNPVRAGLVEHPVQYSWSSYRANAGEEPSNLVTPHALYLELGGDSAERQATYRDLVASGLASDRIAVIRAATNGGHILGSVPGLSLTRP
jgi:putative transposase